MPKLASSMVCAAGWRHDRAGAAEASHHVQQVVDRHVPAGAAGFRGEVAGVPAGAGRERIGQRVRIGMRQRRPADAGRLEQVLLDVVRCRR